MQNLKDSIQQDVKFSEVDSLGIVWHGNYVQYFEDGREAFGKKHNLAYLDFYDHGYVVPIVNIQCDYKRFLRYGDRIIIETIFVNSPSAKMVFEYKISNAKTGELVVTGSTTQVFLSKDQFALQITTPAFFEEWKVQQGLTVF